MWLSSTVTSSARTTAKKAVALRCATRWRRKKLDPAIREEVAPKNILMIGPTAWATTEIARRLGHFPAAVRQVEATRYTEVAITDVDVESMGARSGKTAVNMFQTRAADDVSAQSRRGPEDRLLDALLPTAQRRTESNSSSADRPRNGSRGGSERRR